MKKHLNTFYLMRLVVVLLTALLVSSCATTALKKHGSTKVEKRETHFGKYEFGRASWYGRQFQGRKTASGERFDMKGFTAAHRTLPFGTEIEVTNVSTNETVRVRVNDRGPFIRSRVLDLSFAAAKALGFVGQGFAEIKYRVVLAQ